MRRLRLFVLVAVLALAAAACGDDTTPSSQSSTPATSSPNATPLTNHGTKDAASVSNFTIEVDDNYFQPTFIKVKDGQKLSLELENEGSNQHTFTITALNIDQTIDPGTKKEVEITFSGTTDVAFFCRFHGASGMRGAFFFGSAPGSAGGTTGGTTGNTTY